MKQKMKSLSKKKWFWVVVVLVVLLIAGGTFFLAGGRRAGKAPVASKVQSTKVEKGSIQNTVDGSGNLAVAEVVDVKAPTGLVIESVLVESGDSVEAGQTLATISQASIVENLVEIEESLEAVEDQLEEDDLTNLEIQKLKNQKAELKDAQDDLKILKENPVIIATVAGVIESVNVSEGNEITWSASSGSSTGILTSSSSNAVAKTMSYSTKASTSGVLLLSSQGEALPMTVEGNLGENDTDVENIRDFSRLNITAPVAGAAPQKEIEETETYSGKITWDCSQPVFGNGTVYTATVILTAKDGYQFVEKEEPFIQNASYTCKIFEEKEGNQLKIVAKFEKTAEKVSESTENDQKDQMSNTTSSDVQVSGNTEVSATISENAAGADTSTGNRTSSVSYSSQESSVFTIQTQNQVKVSIQVDELDILSVEEGQSAIITLDALDGEEFEGTITYVAKTATGGNGSTKYKVDILVDKTDDMRIGMSASATIVVSEATDVLVLPMTVLQQRGEQTFVYTSQDEEGNLTGEVQVETGLSNGNTVEIISGLSEGDTVYYTRTGSTDSDEDMFGGFMGGDFEGMPDGNMPGGDAPGGDMPGGMSNGGGAPGNMGGQPGGR